MELLDLVKRLVCSLDKHKALDIRVLHVVGVTSLADYFIVAAGSSSTHVRSLADYAEFELGEKECHPSRVEGYQTSQWVLMDYGPVVVHLFREETRQFYALEHLWKDAEEVDVMSFLDNEGDDNE